MTKQELDYAVRNLQAPETPPPPQVNRHVTEDPVTWPLDSEPVRSDSFRAFERGYKIAIGAMLALVFGFNTWLVWLIWFSR